MPKWHVRILHLTQKIITVITMKLFSLSLLFALLCSCGTMASKKPIVKTCISYMPSLSQEIHSVTPGVVKAAQQIELGFKTAGQIKQFVR